MATRVSSVMKDHPPVVGSRLEQNWNALGLIQFGPEHDVFQLGTNLNNYSEHQIGPSPI